MPMMMSNRSVVAVYYIIEDNADGSLIFIASSRNTDEIVAA